MRQRGNNARFVRTYEYSHMEQTYIVRHIQYHFKSQGLNDEKANSIHSIIYSINNYAADYYCESNILIIIKINHTK